MKKYSNLQIIGLVFVLVVVLSMGYWFNEQSKPGQYDDFAKCLTSKGVKFYGAFWCPHCQAQKALFGKSKEFLPYVECSNPDQKSQTQICVDKGIQSYPTWSFQEASTTASTTGEVFYPGEKTFKELGDKTGCTIPVTQ